MKQKQDIDNQPGVRRMERLLQTILQRNPLAVVGAISGDAHARLVPVPPTLCIPGEQARFEGDSLTNLLVPADRRKVSSIWYEARHSGVGRGSVHFEGSDEPSQLYCLDFRDGHGVFVVVAAPGDSDPVEDLASPGDTVRPSRFSRVVKDPVSTIIEVDESFRRMLGWSPEEVCGQRSLAFIHPDDHEVAIEAWIHMLASAGASRPVRLRHRHKDGHWVWVEITNHNRCDDHGDVVADMVDVTEEVLAQDAARARQQLLEQLTETLPIGLMHADVESRILFANHRLTEITGLAVGHFLTQWPSLACEHAGVVAGVVASALDGHPAEAVVEVIDRSGEVRHCSIRVRPLADSVGAINGLTGSVEDITQEVIERRDLEVRAATDELTGCLNRAATLAVAQDLLDAVGAERPAGAVRPGVAVIFADVDKLKQINDALGHAAGDALIVETAARIQGAVRGHDVVGRYGGDEFVVVLSNIGSAEHAMTVARWISSRLTKPFRIDGQPVELRASLGVAWTDSPGVQASWLIRQADAAMYVSKSRGQAEPVMAGVSG